MPGRASNIGVTAGSLSACHADNTPPRTACCCGCCCGCPGSDCVVALPAAPPCDESSALTSRSKATASLCASGDAVRRRRPAEPGEALLVGLLGCEEVRAVTRTGASSARAMTASVSGMATAGLKCRCGTADEEAPTLRMGECPCLPARLGVRADAEAGRLLRPTCRRCCCLPPAPALPPVASSALVLLLRCDGRRTPAVRGRGRCRWWSGRASLLSGCGAS